MSAAPGPSSTVLVVDHRHSMSVGWPGETALDRCQSAALEVLAEHRRRSEPVGLVTVGDDGITDWKPPSATSTHYATVGSLVRSLQPTPPSEAPEGEPEPNASPSPAVDRANWALGGDDSAFGTTIRAFAGSAADYLHRIPRKQLYGATRFVTRRVPGRIEVVLLTDDTDRSELRTTVDLARKGGNRVAVYLTPRSIFEPRGLADAETTYHGYRQFVRFRRELETREGVSVHEVAPM